MFCFFSASLIEGNIVLVKKALIVGVTGQDGSYLAELLLEKGYEVHATVRRASVFNTARVDHLSDNHNFITYYSDLTDSSSLRRLILEIEPIEVYNLGAQSHVGVSFEVPEYTADCTGVGTIRILDALRELDNGCRYYQASTSELFGGIPGSAPQDERTPFHPKSPYGVAKLYSYWITVNYRESYGLFASNGILFNHESPRRGETFVTRKITRAVGRIACGLQEKLTVGNLEAVRDWGHAADYVEAMWKMLQLSEPSDLVIATGRAATVREFIVLAFQRVGKQIEWKGHGLNEVGVCGNSGRTLVEIDSRYFRPAEVEVLIGDASKARTVLNWKPHYSLEELIDEMVEFDLNLARKEGESRVV